MHSSAIFSPGATTITSKEMYHQIVPHFILRQFHFVPPDRLREKVRNHWRTRNVPGERVFVYDLLTGLQQRPVPRQYSKPDVFKALKDSINLESHLEALEYDTTNIVRSIHYASEAGQVTLSRERLSTLRKFIFVTHYRGLAVHLQEPTSPNSLQSKMEAWVQGLKYYLETSHYDIIGTGERLKERYENSRLSDMLKNRSYPEGEELAIEYALPYQDLADNFFLGIWMAAEDNEFVLSGHSFSLWEGLIGGIPGAHRIHIVSPRIAIILRRTCLHNPKFNDPTVLYSSLADVPISEPLVRYANKDIDRFEVDRYRATAEAQQDSFRYSFTRLSPQQTYAVNEVIMMNTNLRHEGSVVFRDPNAMRETVHLYLASPNTFLGGKNKLFRPIITQLSGLGSQDDSQRGSIRSSMSEDENEPASDCQLRLLLGFMIQNHATFPSAYTRAFLIFHMATVGRLSSPISVKMHRIQDAAIEQLRCFLDPPLPMELQTPSPNKLVQSLTSDESELFFSLIAPLLDQANVSIRRSNDFIATVINEAAIIGVTYWLAEERPDVLREILSHWVHIWA